MSNDTEFAVSNGKFNESAMLLEEMKTVGMHRPHVGELHRNLGEGNAEGPYAIGLALSGGGIRSATVSLGIMQKLAGEGILKHVDYLSTVSGGGFIGSALTWWLRGNHGAERVFDTGKEFPFGTLDPAEPEDPKKPKAPLQYLRTQGTYLTPSRDITIWSGFAILIRAIFLNLAVWVPVTAAIMLFLLWSGTLSFVQGLPWMVRMLAPDALTGIADAVGSRGQLELNQTLPATYLFMILAALAIFLLFVLASLGHSLLSWTSNPPPRGNSSYYPKEGRRFYSWALVGFTGLMGVGLAGLALWWLHPVIEPMFADKRLLEPGLDMTAGLKGRVILGLGIIAALFFVTALVLAITGKEGRPSWLGDRDKTRITVVFVSLIMLLLGAGGAAIFSFPHVSLWLQFVFATGAIAFAFYLVSMLIRYFMRHERFGERKTPADAVEIPAGTSEPPASKWSFSADYFYYAARRLFERNFGGLLFFSLILIAVGSLPLIHSYIGYRIGGTGTALGLLLAAGGNLYGRIAGHGRWTSVFVVAGAILICYSVLLVGYSLASDSMGDGISATKRALLGGAIVFGLILGWFVNTNYIGLHRFYRDRLMEAFMPDFAVSWLPDPTPPIFENAPARRANDFEMCQAWPPREDGKVMTAVDPGKVVPAKIGPYHIVNTNLVIPNSPTRRYRLRGGDNFILSPLFFGSSATEWHRPKDTDFGDISLASAMAISGAAANPRGGAGGRGLTRNAFVSLVMSLLNVRLGYWAPNPRGGKRWILPKRPNHFWPGGVYALGNAFSKGYREDSKWIELADGGHFENLAFYELVRRRCGLIIVCDGGQDNASSYADLVTAVQRIGEDFCARIHFDMQVNTMGKFQDSSPAQMIAKSTNTDFPKGAEFSDKGYCVARVEYGERGRDGWPRHGILIYLKSSLIKTLDARAKGYAGANPQFPNESTGDQFFDEEQFEAYREVGYRICEQMVRDLGLKTLFASGHRPPIEELRCNPRFKPKEATVFGKA